MNFFAGREFECDFGYIGMNGVCVSYIEEFMMRNGLMPIPSPIGGSETPMTPPPMTPPEMTPTTQAPMNPTEPSVTPPEIMPAEECGSVADVALASPDLSNLAIAAEVRL